MYLKMKLLPLHIISVDFPFHMKRHGEIPYVYHLSYLKCVLFGKTKSAMTNGEHLFFVSKRIVSSVRNGIKSNSFLEIKKRG